MKKLFLFFFLLASLGPLVANSILDQQQLQQLINSTLQNEIIAAAKNNPNIYRTVNNDPLYPHGAKYSMDIVKLKPVYFLSQTQETREESGTQIAATTTWSHQSELANPYQPNLPNSPQLLNTPEATFTQTKIIATTTECGWSTAASVESTSWFTTWDELEGEWGEFEEGSLTVGVTAGINVSSSNKTTTSTSTSYRLPATPILVPIGCKAVVTQALADVTLSGHYTFKSTLYNGLLNFTTKDCLSCHEDSGWAYIYNIIASGNSILPQSFLHADPGASDVYINGRGTFNAKVANIYMLTYHFVENDPHYPKCFPPSLAAQKAALAGSKVRNIRQIGRNKFTYSVIATAVASTPPRITISQNRKTAAPSRDACWQKVNKY